MSPIHFDLVQPALNSCGYHFEVLGTSDNKSSVDTGLKYVNNDACYPSVIVVGQIMEALLSGKYDLNKTAVVISQTCVGCRATNYIGFIRRALQKADMPHIPVISMSASGIESNEGFSYSLPMLIKGIMAIVYGDIFMRVLYRTRPYEKEKGAANALHQKWKAVCIKSLSKKTPSFPEFHKNVKGIIKDFDELPLLDIQKPRVGIVGEILVKFLPAANNHLVDLLEEEGAEAVMPDLLDFFLYCFYNANFKAEHLGCKTSTARLCNAGISLLEFFRKNARKELKKIQKELSKFPPSDVIWDIDDLSKQPPWGNHISGEITNLSNYFVTSDGRDLITIMFMAFDDAEEIKHKIQIISL